MLQMGLRGLNDKACMSTPDASMSASRSSILMNFSGSGPSPPAGVWKLKLVASQVNLPPNFAPSLPTSPQ
jgi:hypothetical protein